MGSVFENFMRRVKSSDTGPEEDPEALRDSVVAAVDELGLEGTGDELAEERENNPKPEESVEA